MRYFLRHLLVIGILAFPVSNSMGQIARPCTELGAVFGTPAGLNVLLGYRADVGLFRASGMYFGDDTRAIQISFGINLDRSGNTRHAIGALGGLSVIDRQRWDYVGGFYSLNSHGFHLEIGLSAGEGDFESPQLTLQIGYVHRFFHN